MENTYLKINLGKFYYVETIYQGWIVLVISCSCSIIRKGEVREESSAH